MEALAQHLARGQFGQVLGHMDTAAAQVQVLYGLPLLPGAEDDGQRRILAGLDRKSVV